MLPKVCNCVCPTQAQSDEYRQKLDEYRQELEAQAQADMKEASVSVPTKLAFYVCIR